MFSSFKKSIGSHRLFLPGALLLAQLISLFGSALVQYAIIWHITRTTSSGKILTLSVVCGFVPQLLISLFAGVWADRYPAKWLLTLSDSVIALATLGLAGVFAFGQAKLWQLLLVLALRSAGAGVQSPALGALLPRITPEQMRPRLLGSYSACQAFIGFVAPAASAVLLATLPLQATLLVDVITALLGVSITFCLPLPGPLAKSHSHMLADLHEGFAYWKGQEFLRKLLLYQITVLLLVAPSAFLTPLLVNRHFGGALSYLSLSEMTFSAGAVLGGMWVASRGDKYSPGQILQWAGLGYGLLMIAMGLAPWFGLYLCVNFSIGITMPCYNTAVTLLLQKHTDPAFLGRMSAFAQMVSSTALPLGMVLFGPLADYLPIGVLLAACGLGVCLLPRPKEREKGHKIPSSLVE